MLIVDANAILRYILLDNEGMALQVDDLLKQKVVTIRCEVIAEVVYVLNRVYSMPKNEVSACVTIFLEHPNINVHDNDILMPALELYGANNFDFIDCLLYSFVKVRGCRVFTFDKKLNNLLNGI